MINLIKKNLRAGRRQFKRFRERIFPISVLVEKEIVQKTINNFKSGDKPAFFIDTAAKQQIIRLLGLLDSEFKKTIQDEADFAYNHNFNLLGSGIVNLGKKIPWNTDFKTGFRWPQKYYLDMLPIDPIGDPIKQKLKYDGKCPYELSRFQHFTLLGQAYWLMGDTKYSQEFVSQIKDWMENNPPFFGVNWTCSMELAIRASNWIQGLYFFKDSDELNDEFLSKIFKNLIISGRYIKRNLEKSWRGFAANHYLADIAGMVFLGIFFKDLPEGKKWLDFGISELKKEMKKQVYPDGCDFEASTCYHRLAMELFFFSTLLAVINNEDFKKNNYREISEKIFGKEYVGRLYKMFEAALYLLKPNGRMPQIGDNDNGRFFIFKKRDITDMKYLLNLGAVFFNELKFKINEFGFCQDLVWIFGENGYKAWEALKENKSADLKSKDFPDSGWYVFRNGSNYCLVSCGSNGQNGNGGHCHNDKLSFELAIRGKDLIIDPGTYLYTGFPEWRNRFRSTAFHNTIAVDGEEQNRITENNLFFSRNDAKVRINKRGTDGDFDILDAQHHGYKRLKNPIIHRRIFAFNKKNGYLAIKDILTGKGSHVFDLYFHPNSASVKKDSNNPLIANAVYPDGVGFSVIPLETEGLRLALVESWISSGYGKKEPAQALKYSKTAQIPASFTTLIVSNQGQVDDINSIKEELNSLFKKI